MVFLFNYFSGEACGIIGVTEPRRVAAVCMAKRVAEEMNLSSRFILESALQMVVDSNCYHNIIICDYYCVH